MNVRILLLCFRLLCFSEHAAHGDMMGVLGERYTPKATVASGQRMRVGAVTFRNCARKLYVSLKVSLKNIFK